MKRLFYLTLAACACIGCHNEADLTPPANSTGQVQLQVKNAPQGTIIDGQFVFGSGDKVLMTATVNEQSISNSFTYNGGRWTQDAPEGDYKNILWQDNPTINLIISYGGNTTPSANTLDQSNEIKYIGASELVANAIANYGSIEYVDGMVSARLDHANADLALKVYDGYDENNTLDEGTPTLTVIVDGDGLGPGSATKTYTAWNAGKHTDDDGTYTLFRVQLPYRCCILKAELSNVNATAGDLQTEIHFRAQEGQPSNEIDLERGKRYNASYTYDMLKTVATVSVSITPFEGTQPNDLSANNGWTFDHNTQTYIVYTAEGLQQVNQKLTDFTDLDYTAIVVLLNSNITLAADITLPTPTTTDGSNWTPIGDDNYYFRGDFNGNGHTIRGLVVRSNPNAPAQGLLGFTVGNVSNLTLEGCTVIGNKWVGSIVGINYGYDITNCKVIATKDYPIWIESAGGFVGGITGRHFNGTILNTSLVCESGASITIKNTGQASNVGGIAGQNDSGAMNECSVINNGGTITITSVSNNVGGFVGQNYSSEDIHCVDFCIRDCSVNGVTVTGAEYVGGFVGWNDEYAEIRGTNTVTNSAITGKNGSTSITVGKNFSVYHNPGVTDGGGNSLTKK